MVSAFSDESVELVGRSFDRSVRSPVGGYLGKPSARRFDGFSQIETHLEAPPG